MSEEVEPVLTIIHRSDWDSDVMVLITNKQPDLDDFCNFGIITRNHYDAPFNVPSKPS